MERANGHPPDARFPFADLMVLETPKDQVNESVNDGQQAYAGAGGAAGERGPQPLGAAGVGLGVWDGAPGAAHLPAQDVGAGAQPAAARVGRLIGKGKGRQFSNISTKSMKGPKTCKFVLNFVYNNRKDNTNY